MEAMGKVKELFPKLSEISSGEIAALAAHAKFWRGAASRRRNRGLHTDPGGRNSAGHTKKATPENLLG